jgi:aspartate/methionine/tyrosine aminotransferase
VDTFYEGCRPPSIFQVDGAAEVAVEFTSLSKTYNMAGWRLGVAAGNPDVLYHLNLYKTLADNSTFLPLLSAGSAALSGSQDWLEERNRVYQARRDAAVRGLQALGFRLQVPAASLYVWAKIPHNNEGSLAFCARILDKTGVSITPGIIFGEHGEGYIRVSLCTSQQEIRRAMLLVQEYLQQSIH